MKIIISGARVAFITLLVPKLFEGLLRAVKHYTGDTFIVIVIGIIIGKKANILFI